MGMPRFDDALSATDTKALHAYLVDQERQAYEAQKAAPSAAH
jgi:quinohemoprotein ethanol dehydrogenase